MADHTIVGKRPLIGATSQASTPVEITMTWKTTGGTVINASASAIFSNGSLKHGAEVKRLKDGKGGRCTVLSTDEDLSLEVTAVPVGAAGVNALSDALKAATLPACLGFCEIKNGPDMAFGPYVAGNNGTGNSADHFGAINGTNWLYEGGGTVEINNETEWGLKFTVVRSQNIAAQNAVSL